MDWKRRRTLPDGPVRRVAIVGGTHGNETNGVHLAKHFKRTPELTKRPSFEVEVLLANTGAIAQNTRYVEEDLNRCYLEKELADDSKATTIERKRAREIDDALGPKRSPEPRCDLVIDLHNTTAATDICLLMAPDDFFAHEIAHHLHSLDDGVRVVNWFQQDDWALCPSVARSGMTFEVGPCPWGCIMPSLFQRSARLLSALLDYVQAHNELIASGKPSILKQVAMPVYHAIGVSIDYPRNDDGEIIGMVHPELQNQDFKELKDGDPIFLTFAGETKTFRRGDYKHAEAQPKVYALFVNEAAYYEKGMAFMLMRKEDEKPFSMLREVDPAAS